MTFWLSAGGVGFVAYWAVRLARKLALKKALVDRPNERSSHTLPVPRLGGAAFVPVVLGASGLVAWHEIQSWSAVATFIAAAVVLYGIGLMDDVRPLPARLRLAGHVLAAAVFVWVVGSVRPEALAVSGLSNWIVVGSVILWIVGLLNIYNFMDGIDGLAGTQAVVAGVTWTAIGVSCGAPYAVCLGAFTAAGGLGFLVLNWPPAKIFMGDAGSTVLGFLFSAMPLLVGAEARAAPGANRLLLAAGLIVWPFLADGAFTILRRLRKRENIFRAHRSHLYQRLVIAGNSHRQVTGVYGCMAAGCALTGWLVVARQSFPWVWAALVPLSSFVVLWLWTVRSERGSYRP